ncbi:MAG TPA: hypothetical protein PKN44_15680 [Bacteroidales bacterium]|nr:hypothetical protein [Bacteroidales bacterium]
MIYQTFEALGFLTRLIESDYFYKGLIEVALGIVLQADGARSTDSMTFYRYETDKNQSGNSYFKMVDFRVPLAAEKRGKEFLYIVFTENILLSTDSIINRFGHPIKIEVPTPQESSGTGVNVIYVYTLGKWVVSFSFGPGPQEILRSVSFDFPQ